MVDMFRAHIIDVTPDSMTVEAAGTTDKLEALVRMLEPFGVRELVQSGMVALGRGAEVDHLRARCAPTNTCRSPRSPVAASWLDGAACRNTRSRQAAHTSQNLMSTIHRQ